MKYYLSIDIGASSGRHILGCLKNGLICLEEIYRFENNALRSDEALLWDIDSLVREVKAGIKKCAEIGKTPCTVAIDTWAVDYVLLDKAKQVMRPVYAYRDTRTAPIVSEVEAVVPARELYERTGIQKQDFNSIYQLFCDKKSGRLKKAEYFLMIPEYLVYCLTGVMKNEYTNATTTGLVNVQTKKWDGELLDKLGIKKSLFAELSMPGTLVGSFTATVRSFVGFDAEVILCPTHDTASAVAACPIRDNSAYISSGTWSLIGIESNEPIISETGRMANFTNEGGIEYRYRVLKNIMGMWLLQNIRRDLNKAHSYDEMMKMAMESEFTQTIDVNSSLLVAPDNMINAVKALLRNPNLPLKDVINCVYHSLAQSYAQATQELNALTGRKVSSIQIIGGGSQDDYLNRLTAEYTGLSVQKGAAESTAIGNLISQMIYDGVFSDVTEARKCVGQTCEKIESVFVTGGDRKLSNDLKQLLIGKQKNIALIAHDSKKRDMVRWCERNKEILKHHFLCGTGTTAKIIAEINGLPVKGFNSGPLGGDQQVGARIVEGKIDIVIFFADPLCAQPHDPDVKALLRIAQVYDIPIALNQATADFLLASALMENEYEHSIIDFAEQIKTRAAMNFLIEEE
jgi:rhamnulokinase